VLFVASGGAVGWDILLQTQKSRVRFPTVSLGFFTEINSSGRTMALGFKHRLTEMSTRNISWGGKGGRCRSLTILLVPTVLKFLKPQIPATPKACPGLQWERFTFFVLSDVPVANGLTAPPVAIEISKCHGFNTGQIGRRAVKHLHRHARGREGGA